MTKRTCGLIVVILIASAGLAAATDNRTPSSVTGYSLLGFVNPALDPTHDYEDPSAVLGPPTTLFHSEAGFGNPGGDFHLSMVVGASNRDLSGGTLVTSIQPGGYITVQFDTPIEDDPNNWFGKDFIVFGNGFFSGTGFVYPTTNMSTHRIGNVVLGNWEPSVVSVSQDGETWHSFSSGPYADDFAPTQAFSWDRVGGCWDLELDWTKPVDPALTKSSFANKTVADAIDMYNGSAGGTAFDISGLPLDANANGRKWVRYIKVTGSGGEVDAITRVTNVPPQTPIGAAKQLENGASVRLAEGIVVAGTAELGDCVYIEALDRACGIRVTGRSIKLGKRVIVSGVMATSNGERKLKALAVEELGTESVEPLMVTGRAFAAGLSISGLLVKLCGQAGSVDYMDNSFVIDDGSGAPIKCRYPPTAMVDMSTIGGPTTVTGVASYETDAQQNVVPVLRVWAEEPQEKTANTPNNKGKR